MQKILPIIIAIIATSCYFFPFELRAFPGVNSKMALAAFSLVLLGINISQHRENAEVDKGFVTLSLWALALSAIAFLSCTINGTHDGFFTTYFMSMWVWLGGAYGAITIIKWAHDKISIRLFVSYLITVCVLQCILAVLFDLYPNLESWHGSVFGGSEGYLGNLEGSRLHGIGCALDVAGFRFAAVLVMISFFINRAEVYNKFASLSIYIWDFIIILTLGCMISRSTIIGAGIGIAYIIFASLKSRNSRLVISRILLWIAVVVPIVITLYSTNPNFQRNIEFGFEGFFSLAETGEWQTNSNDILENMIVFPDNIKTWIIGDGRAQNPGDVNNNAFDPYYIGPKFGGYYMNTDIGYCRFIFYFGLLGTLTFIFFFIKVCSILCKRFPDYKYMFIMILMVNFIGWCKVSTDIFMVFAPFLCLTSQKSLKDESEQAY